MNNRTLITNAFVLSMDDEVGDLPDANILIEDGRIAGIGPGLTAKDALCIDAGGCIAIPGLVDTHRHIWQGALRGATADWSLLGYLGGIRMLAARQFRPEDMYAAQLHGGMDAINTGVTTVADYCHNIISLDHAEASIQGLQDSRLRAVWCFGFNQPPLPDSVKASLQERTGWLSSIAAQYFTSPDARLTLGVSPEESHFWLHDTSLAQHQFGVARELDARIFFHCNSFLMAGKGMGEVELLARSGLLGSDITLVHMNRTSPDEWNRVADAGATVSVTPETELQMGMGLPAIAAPLARGIPLGLGVDIVSNNSGDPFVAMRLALQVERWRQNEEQGESFFYGLPFTCRDALHWATLGGARACGLDREIGSLRPGKCADIVLLRADGVSMAGWNRENPAAAVVLHASAENVETVLVDGEIVKQSGRLRGDEVRACRLLQDASNHIHESCAAQGGLNPGREALFERMQGTMPPQEIDRIRASSGRG
ncbi:amidohydrolase family protein [Kineobactrum salinum]|uniref:Amidohydrolase family protein n=1 Tax=Kineobactrum salinum TaxID=2708301 RepID=A0A6C0TYP5_9GAMM|nr:amidohydrolase family protein [Kineobactrum salinum]QIB64921.1 amidohydrolase family protein [Kineobactrum salinum]